MTNQPPREVMEAPEGYEWTGVIHCPRKSELYAEWREDRWETSIAAIDRDFMAPILRKIKSPTVMVELPRALTKTIANTWPDKLGKYDEPWMHEVGEACRCALENEDE